MPLRTHDHLAQLQADRHHPYPQRDPARNRGEIDKETLEFREGGRPEPVVPKVSQETLAEMVGTTRSRVSFFMNKFRKLGFIEYNGGLHVHSSLMNLLLHS